MPPRWAHAALNPFFVVIFFTLRTHNCSLWLISQWQWCTFSSWWLFSINF
jgi:hypothetical protein